MVVPKSVILANIVDLDYWLSRVYRHQHIIEDEVCYESEYCVQMEIDGQRETIYLKTWDRLDAALKAQALCRESG